MHANPGDWLVVNSSTVDVPARRGVIREVHGTDGTPPFVVRWDGHDHDAVVFPGPDAHVETSATSTR